MPFAHSTDAGRATLLDAKFLAKLERLTLAWGRSFKGLVGGRTPARFAGAGQEFLDHRNFHPGDDLRNVNWQAFMRLNKLFLRTFQVEPRVPVRLLLDTSASMAIDASSGQPDKFTYASRLAAAIVYIGLVRLDKIEIQPFAEDLLEPFSLSGGRNRFQPAEAFLRHLPARGQTNLEHVARRFLTLYPQSGLTIVISDFLQAEDCLRSLQMLADLGHEVLLLQIWTPSERRPEFAGETKLTDVETGQQRSVLVDERSRNAYTAAFDRYSVSLEQWALRNGGRHLGLSTDTPLEDVLFGPHSLAATV